jgi:hypothetical protein
MERIVSAGQVTTVSGNKPKKGKAMKTMLNETLGLESQNIIGGGKYMQKYIMIMMAGMLLASSGTVFAAPGGVLPDGQGTNQVYGDVNGRDQTLRNIKTANVDGSGVTNINAANIAPGTVLTAIDGSAITNLASGGITSLDASKLVPGSTASAINGTAITNIPIAGVDGLVTAIGSLNNATNVLNIRAGDLESATGTLHTAVGNLNDATNALNSNKLSLSGGTMTGSLNLGGTTVSNGTFNGTFIGDGSGLANVTADLMDTNTVTMGMLNTEVKGEFIGTNAASQAKAGLLTLNGGVTVAGNAVFTPSTLQSIATGASIAATSAVVQVVGNGAAVTATIDAGTAEGQTLLIRGTSDVNSVTLTNTVPTFMLGTNDVMALTWNGSVWVEQYRRDN